MCMNADMLFEFSVFDVFGDHANLVVVEQRFLERRDCRQIMIRDMDFLDAREVRCDNESVVSVVDENALRILVGIKFNSRV